MAPPLSWYLLCQTWIDCDSTNRLFSCALMLTDDGCYSCIMGVTPDTPGQCPKCAPAAFYQAFSSFFSFHSCTVHFDTIESFIYPTDAQVDCSKNVKIYIKIYMRGAPTCFGFLQPSSGSYYMCFAKVISINNRLKYVVYRISSV